MVLETTIHRLFNAPPATFIPYPKRAGTIFKFEECKLLVAFWKSLTWISWKFYFQFLVPWCSRNETFIIKRQGSTKEVVEKNDFFHPHPLLIGRYFLSFFIKNRFFRKFFAQIYIFIKNPFFWHFFLKFFVIKVPIATRTENLFFFYFFWKSCLQSMGVIFFCVFENKKFKLNTRMRGGGRKVHFSKSTFWITSRETKSPLFSQTLSSFKGYR